VNTTFNIFTRINTRDVQVLRENRNLPSDMMCLCGCGATPADCTTIFD